MSAWNKLTLHQALRGRGLRSVERDILQCMASYGNYDLTGVKPALDTVAREYGFDIKTVRDAVHSLTAKGFLPVVRKGGGRNNPTEYKIVNPPETLPPGGSVSAGEADGNPTVSDPETLPSDAVNPTVSARKPYRPAVGDQLTTNSLPVKNNQSRPDAAIATPDAFEAFFNCYPKQQHKTLARAAFDKLVATGEVTAEELAKRARRYSAECQEKNRDPKYVRMPENWLDHLSDPGKANWTGYPPYLLCMPWDEMREVSKAVYDQEMAGMNERQRLQKQWS